MFCINICVATQRFEKLNEADDILNDAALTQEYLYRFKTIFGYCILLWYTLVNSNQDLLGARFANKMEYKLESFTTPFAADVRNLINMNNLIMYCDGVANAELLSIKSCFVRICCFHLFAERIMFIDLPPTKKKCLGNRVQNLWNHSTKFRAKFTEMNTFLALLNQHQELAFLSNQSKYSCYSF